MLIYLVSATNGSNLVAAQLVKAPGVSMKAPGAFLYGGLNTQGNAKFFQNISH